MVVYNELYSLSAYKNQIQFYKTHLYENNVQRPDESILSPINVGLESDTKLDLIDVKTIMNNIYIFYYVRYIEGSLLPRFDDYYAMRVYNVNTNEWYDEELDFEIQKVFSAGRYLFTCKTSGAGDSLTSIFDEKLGYWIDVRSPELLDKQYMFSYGEDAYFKNSDTVVRLNLATRIITSKTIPSIKNAGTLGFTTADIFYVYTYPGKIYTFNFDAGTGSETGCQATSRILTNGKLYCCESGKVKRLDIAAGETQWKDYTYNLFTTSSTEMLAGYNMMYIKTQKGVSTEYEVSYEKINLDPWNNEHRICTEYAYNDYRQQTGKTVFAYKDQDGQMNKKAQYSETTEYEPGHSAVKKTTDRLGNITQYEYVNSPHYIPTKVTQKYAGGPTVVTENVLLDSNRISDETTTYSDRTVKTTYTYSASSPGNVASETTDEIKNGVTTRVGRTEYLYNTDPGCPGEAYVTRKTLSGIQTNDENYNRTKTLNQSIDYTYYWQTGLKKSETDALARTTSYEYNYKGWLTKTTNPDNTAVIMKYDINGSDNPVKTILYIEGRFRTVLQH